VGFFDGSYFSSAQGGIRTPCIPPEIDMSMPHSARMYHYFLFPRDGTLKGTLP
jgi:hypothetical protein